jgi:hypothetical protein
MKKYLSLLVFTLLFSMVVFAQTYEITPSYGYQFGTRFDYGIGYIKAEPSGQWGISAGAEVQPGMVVKLSYVSMATEGTIRDIDINNGNESRFTDLQNDWFLLGVQKYLKDGKVKPFVGGGLGLLVVSPKNEALLECTGCLPRGEITPNIGSNTYFAFNFEAGVNIMLTEVIGINVQGNLYIPVNYGGFYFGTGGIGVTTGSSQILGGFSGGLIFRIDAN